LRAGHVLVTAEQWHRGVLAIVVVELLVRRRFGRLPHALAVAALAREHVAALELVRLIVVVTARGTAQPVGAHVDDETLLVLVPVAFLAVGLRVLAVERPAGLVVVEALLFTGHRLPSHDVVAASFVIAVAGPAALALHRLRRVKAFAGADAIAQ